MFYPGTSDVSRATPLAIEPGTAATTVDLLFTRSRTARVTGFAFDAPGQPLGGGVLLFESQRSGGVMLEPRKAGTGAEARSRSRTCPPFFH